MPSTRALLHAPWSASKVATALRCPRLFHYKYVDKIKEPEVMPEARIGKAFHQALEWALQGTPSGEALEKAKGKLADEIEQRRLDQLGLGVAPFLDRITRFKRRRTVQRQLVEYSLAIRDDGTTTSFYSGDAYFRGIVDLAYLFDDGALAIVDHKTGMRYPGSSIGDQMDGYAVLAAAAFRSATRIWLGIHWANERAVEWAAPLGATEVAERLAPALIDNTEAAALAVDDGPLTHPGPWCERCAYRGLCPAARETRNDPVEYDEDDDA